MGNDVLMTRLFIGSLKGIFFAQFQTLPVGSFNSWADLEARFLICFHEDDIEVFMPTLIEEKQRKGEAVKDFIERLRNLFLRCPEGMPLSMLLQTCRCNLHAKIKSNMGVVRAHTGKKLQEQVKIIEKTISRFFLWKIKVNTK